MTDAALIIGLRVRLECTIDAPCACGETTVVIGQGAGPHVASLQCAGCNRHRGWLPKAIAEFLVDVVMRFGRPADAAIRNATSEFAQANEAAQSVQAQLPLFPHHEPKRN